MLVMSYVVRFLVLLPQFYMHDKNPQLVCSFTGLGNYFAHHDACPKKPGCPLQCLNGKCCT
jgi:hypothetical protein